MDRTKTQRLVRKHADGPIKFQFLGCAGKFSRLAVGGESQISGQVLPIDEYEKAKLLPIRSARLRLKLVSYWIDQLNSNW